MDRVSHKLDEYSKLEPIKLNITITKFRIPTVWANTIEACWEVDERIRGDVEFSIGHVDFGYTDVQLLNFFAAMEGMVLSYMFSGKAARVSLMDEGCDLELSIGKQHEILKKLDGDVPILTAMCDVKDLSIELGRAQTRILEEIFSREPDLAKLTKLFGKFIMFGSCLPLK